MRDKYDHESLIAAIIAGLTEHQKRRKEGCFSLPHFIVCDHVREFISKQLYALIEELEGEVMTTEYIARLLDKLIR